MILASLFAWQGQMSWNDLSVKYSETLNDGVVLIEEYESIREDYFVLLKEKMNTGYSQYRLNGVAPDYMSECPILPPRDLNGAVVNSRLEILKEKLRRQKAERLAVLASAPKN